MLLLFLLLLLPAIAINCPGEGQGKNGGGGGSSFANSGKKVQTRELSWHPVFPLLSYILMTFLPLAAKKETCTTTLCILSLANNKVRFLVAARMKARRREERKWCWEIERGGKGVSN